MAIRTSKEAVALLMAPGADYDGSSELDPFIETANSMVTWVQANASSYGRIPMAAANAEICERWLSAHYYKMSDQQQSNSIAGRSSAQFRGTSTMGFMTTTYGQTAMNLDTTGILKAMDERRIASAKWVGKPVSEQIAYVDRN